ncbi:hypothetical protein [Meiothermus taiwanensis]|uniref:hypothetical protein n=1 Tax=Meiothermus taiwanensis TaxID=172827 RepID=UPI0004064502
MHTYEDPHDAHAGIDADKAREAEAVLPPLARAELARLAGAAGLAAGEEVIFTSEALGAARLERSEVLELLRLADLFASPSRTETFSLAAAEAALAGNLLLLNAHLPAHQERADALGALLYPFPGYDWGYEWGAPRAVGGAGAWEGLARRVLHALEAPPLRGKRHARKELRYEAVWERYLRAMTAARPEGGRPPWCTAAGLPEGDRPLGLPPSGPEGDRPPAHGQEPPPAPDRPRPRARPPSPGALGLAAGLAAAGASFLPGLALLVALPPALLAAGLALRRGGRRDKALAGLGLLASYWVLLARAGLSS